MDKTTLQEAMNDLRKQYQVRSETLKTLFIKAREFYSRGAYFESEQAYQQLININDGNADYYAGLGQVYQAQGKFYEAAEAFLKALKLDSLPGNFHYNFGSILDKIDLPSAVLQTYRDIIRDNLHQPGGDPGFLEDFENSLDAIISLVSQAIDREPNGHLYLMRGNLYMTMQDIPQAITDYDRALKTKTTDPVINKNLAIAYGIGQDIAQASYYDGLAWFYQKNYREAIISLQKCLETGLSNRQIYTALAVSHYELKQFDEAIHAYQVCIRNYPSSARVYIRLTEILSEVGRTEEAIEVARQGIQACPENLILKYLYWLMLPVLYDRVEEIACYRQRFISGLADVTNNTPLTTEADGKRALDAVSYITNFYLSYQNCNDRDLHHQYGHLVNRVMEFNFPEFAKAGTTPLYDHDSKIRVGYISSCFNRHSVANIALGWVQYLDKKSFEVHCYHTDASIDEVTEQFRRHASFFHHIPHNFEALCQQVIQDKLHILVFTDIGMDPHITKVAALRLAPIQCAALGHPVTSGIPTIDYFISSEIMEPEQAQEHYSEKLTCLPKLGYAYLSLNSPKSIRSRADFGIREDAIVYGCWQSTFKYLPQHDAIFAYIAHRVPNAQFVFIDAINAPITARFQTRLKTIFSHQGLDSEAYCLFLPKQSWLDYLSLPQVTDIFLDTIGWSGGITTMEALAFDLPVVTLPGEFLRGRQSFGMLRMLGMDETIAASESDYMEIAVQLGVDREYRQQISQKIHRHKHKLYNDTSWVTTLEAFYKRIAKELV